ncbi:MAG: S8 family serine peptidase [Ancrocorticia sp.]
MTQCRQTWRRRAAALVATAALATGSSLPAFADNPDDDAASNIDESPVLTPLNAEQIYDQAATLPEFTGKWFVELEGEPVINGGSAPTIGAQQENFSQDLSEANIEVEQTFEALWNGVVVTANQTELEEIVKADNVKAIFPVLTVKLPPEEPGSTVKPAMDYARGLTGVESVYEELGLTGAGVQIGIIDSGIDIDHPAFGGNGIPGQATFPGKKVVAGYDFVGDEYNADAGAVPVPDDIPDDCMGHGTHVAGIAAGNDATTGFRGVAPDATLGSYRVFGCDGTTDDTIILQAMEQAFHDDMDVVNLSLGSPMAWWVDYPTAVAADNLASAGITVVAAQGNMGGLGIFSGGVPASSRLSIAVGSVYNAMTVQDAFSVEEELVGYQMAYGSMWTPVSGEVQLAAYPEGNKTGAVDLPGTPFTNKAVVVSRGDSSSYEKGLAAQKDGAEALIIYGTGPAAFETDVYGEEWVEIPVLTVTHDHGVWLESLIADSAEPVILTWTLQKVDAPYYNAGHIVDSSSWGVTGDLEIKPDVLAPGGNIYSAVPLDGWHPDGSGYAEMNGTSMASPHVAGGAALLLEANPGLDTSEIKTILQNSALPVQHAVGMWNEQPLEWLSPIHRQGAGLINMVRAIHAAQPSSKMRKSATPSTVTPAKINLRDGDVVETTSLTISNSSQKAITYQLDVHDSTVNTYGPNNAPLYTAPYDLRGSTTFSQDSVTIPAGQSRTIDVTIAEPTISRDGTRAVDKGAAYGGYLLISGNDGSESRVPFFGITGNYESDRGFVVATNKQIYGLEGSRELNLDPDALYQSPQLAEECRDFDKCNPQFQEVTTNNHIFDISRNEFPMIGYHVESPILELIVHVFHAKRDGTRGALVSEHPIIQMGPRGTTSEMSYLAWNGALAESTETGEPIVVESGRYILQLTAAKGIGGVVEMENWLSRPFRLETGNGPAAQEVVVDNGWDGQDLENWELPAAAVYMVGDWDGDGVDSPLWSSGNTFSYVNNLGDRPVTFRYGREGDGVVVGDWDGDGGDGIAVRRGALIYYQNKLSGGRADGHFYFGRADDAVHSGDWDGDGKDTVSVQRGKTFFVNNSLSGGNMSGHTFGREGDTTLSGDWDGNGSDSFAVIRDGMILVNNQLSGGPALARELAIWGDQYLVGDWNGDGADTLAILRFAAKG